MRGHLRVNLQQQVVLGTKMMVDQTPRDPGETVNTIDRETAQSIPLGRPGKLNEIAKTVTWLASEDAGYITGTDILVDGGIVKSN